MTFAELVRPWPVIPAVRSAQDLAASVRAPSRIVYLLCGTVVTVPDLIAELTRSGKVPFVNIDLQAGLGKDAAAVAFLARAGAAGIISTHPETLRATRQRGLFSVQRSFILDSQALANALRALERFEPDAVELLPAPAALRVAGEFARAHPELPLVAGGLVASLHEIDELVQRGLHAVSVSAPELWAR